MVPEDFLKPSIKALIDESNVLKKDKPLYKLAYVGTPCQIQALRKAQLLDSEKVKQEWPRRVKFSIALFCAESFPYSKVVELTEKHGRNIGEVKKWDIKGKLIAYTDKDKFEISLKEAKKFARENCHYCLDYTGELGDISTGAVGSERGWNTVIVRTPTGLNIVEGAIKEGYLEAKEIDLASKGIGLLKKLSRRKFKGAWKNKSKKEKEARVLHLDTVHETDLDKLLELTTVEHRIDELLRDVVEPGLCVTCGACEASCAEGIIKIDEEGTPYKIKDCNSTDCGRCYATCPRTTLPIDLIEEKLFGSKRYLFDKRILGQYIKIYTARATEKVRPKKAQDGGATSAILKYALDKGIIDANISIAQGDKPWYPIPYISVDEEDLRASAGTVYSSAPTITALKRALTQHQEYSKYLNFLINKGFLPEIAIAEEEAAKLKTVEEVKEVDLEEIMKKKEKFEAAIEKLSKPKVKMLIEKGDMEKAIEAIVKE